MVIADQAYRFLEQAVARHDHDLFFKPGAKGWLIYGRQAAQNRLLQEVDREQGQALINYFKFNGQMDLSEHRRPQIGAWHFHQHALNLDLRLAAVADFQNRECLVIRLLHELDQAIRFVAPQRFDQLCACLPRRGLFLFAGPTGSGKTTLLYSLAHQLSQNQVILAIEDPTEINAPDVTQLQVNGLAQMDYPALLKISLRLRPDVLIIGEIRDQETALIALQAALSGHTVLATVHARSCAGIVERLLDLGVGAAALANCLTAICYQRLIPQNDSSLAVALAVLTDQRLLDLFSRPAISTTNEWEVWQNDLQQARRAGRISNAVCEKYAWG
ncbi:competence type IV pilus ATPase ComGA [Lapidilactobacillus luobeiensis]|uniref:competence type IV pilus ATPase ComGA n=1 Tax=Lapidilactobacillus luobeiensis TaxID=2950371 RepID=UPI0021C26126|nr:competence type IV pilus ATPase ComGA [Lapidilactobacillus luobeiensis]